jgi:hypothetical protein
VKFFIKNKTHKQLQKLQHNSISTKNKTRKFQHNSISTKKTKPTNNSKIPTQLNFYQKQTQKTKQTAFKAKIATQIIANRNQSKTRKVGKQMQINKADEGSQK